ncbi:MAG: hypothetical protein EHM42_09055, partial [Planctomycetaceae bacterium]
MLVPQVCVLLVLASPLTAGVFSIRPIEFINGPTYSRIATGTISTVGNTSVIDDWNLTVTTSERLARYTPANTVKNSSMVSVSSDGQRLTVATSPDPSNEDGGFLGFRSPNPFLDVGTVLADFTGFNVNGGQAMFMYGPAFDFLDLNQPSASDYLAAEATASGANVFDLVPLAFANGVTLSGTIQTDG